MKKKNLIYIGIVGVLAIIIILAIIFRPEKNKIVKFNPEFAKYISAYTSGIISKTSSIKITLTDETVSKLKSKEVLPNDIFKFSPNIVGKASWAGENSIEFIPNEKMLQNTLYLCEFKLGKLIDVENDFKFFAFNFRTIKQDLKIEIDQLKTIDKKTLQWQKLIGHIELNDVEDQDIIEKAFFATYESQNLKIKWENTSENKSFRFEIDSIQRYKERKSLKISWNGENIDIDKSGDKTIEIPSIYDFIYTDYKIYNQPEQYLALHFSDPLNENQLLDGLITINGVQNLSFIIDENIVKVYPTERLKGDYNINIYQGIKNILDTKLKTEYSFNILFEDLKPEVRLVSKGVIFPSNPEGMYFAFESVNLNAVDVSISKIYENNIKQFLQTNEINGQYELHRVSKNILTKKINLQEQITADLSKWNKFNINLTELINADPGSIYRIMISFKKEYSVYNCSESKNEETETENSAQDEYGYEYSEDGYYYDDYYYNDNYWENRNNPCHEAYYQQDRAVSQNILASDIGIIAKKGKSNNLHIYITDILTVKPLSNVSIEIFDFQQQLIKSAKTNSEGICLIENIEDAYFIVATYNNQKGYIKLNDGQSLSLSQFDVGGTNVIKGQKGFIYGERGVWRPGDSIYLSLIHEDNLKLPDNHPVVLELRNPKYQLVQKIVEKKNDIGHYVFKLKTDSEAPTGNWTAEVNIGGTSYSKTLKIETIKPNRLKIKLDFDDEKIVAKNVINAKLSSMWLHGSIAKNLKAQVDVVLKNSSISFEKYKKYNFNDPTLRFSSEEFNVFNSSLNEQGEAKILTDLATKTFKPGKLIATFVTKVFETGGNFSIDQFSIPYYPYSSVIGIKSANDNIKYNRYETDTNHVFDIVILDINGNPIKESHSLQCDFFKVDWNWWWDNSDNANYYNNSYNVPIKSEKIYSENGRAKWSIKANYPDWGRYLIRITDKTSGHTTGQFIYMDWPGWRGRNKDSNAQNATMLTFSADKEKYNVDETATIYIPSSTVGKALVSIENGSSILKSEWIETKNEITKYSFKITKDMAPNIYVHISLIQPHSQTINDLPIRLYGLLPLNIEDKETILEPVINMPDVLKSEETISIKVSEKNNKDMSYTLAIVDDGLLDLTKFKTPNPWEYFFAKEALGVKTWDLYEWVIGAYGAKIEKILNIGGGDEAEAGGGKKANRFKPMVYYIGPFFLKGGKSNTHTIKIPNYIGSVRTMVVAGYNKSYGKAEKTTPVKKSLMVLGTLPRVLGPGETVKLPVTVFAMEKNIKNVNISIKTNNIFTLNGANSQNITFNTPGEETAFFELNVKPETGIGKVEIIASAGNEKAKYDIEIDVRNPNPRITNIYSQTIETNGNWSYNFSLPGVKGTNNAILEISSIPPLNLEKRLKYLIQYPYGCIEQTTSSVFPQLYLSSVSEIDENQKEFIDRNIKAGILRLVKFQQSSGGLGYWPNSNVIDQWGTNYAGHFILEAQKKGYNIPEAFIKNWKKYQKSRANSWKDDGNISQLIQSYRLYTLALAGDADFGAMNRLKETKNITNIVKWQLAATYAISGKNKISEEIIQNVNTIVNPYTEMSYTYGSTIRDMAIILECLGTLNKKNEAMTLLRDISNNLSSETWYSTQSTAYSLLAISKFISQNNESKEIKFNYSINNSAPIVKSTFKPILQTKININQTGDGEIKINNLNKNIIYARLILDGIPATGETTDYESDLKLETKYYLLDGTQINPERITQGTDFIAEVKIIHPGIRLGYEQMALNQIFPSGWEIINTRMTETGNITKSSYSTYQDFKDDRVYTFFNLYRYKTNTYKVLLNASYEGRFYMPSVLSEAMYDHTIQARKKGMWVEVVKP